MFKRKNKRTLWLNTLIRIEELYAEGYQYTKASSSFLWFKNKKNGIKTSFGLPVPYGVSAITDMTDALHSYLDHKKRLDKMYPESPKKRLRRV